MLNHLNYINLYGQEMSDLENKPNGNVIDLAKERKRQRGFKKQKSKQKQGDGSTLGVGPKRWATYLQLFVFLAVIWYFTRTCSG